MTVKAPKGVQGILVNSDPERFFVPKYVGSKGWVGSAARPGPPPDWEEMAEIIYESYCLSHGAREAARGGQCGGRPGDGLRTRALEGPREPRHGRGLRPGPTGEVNFSRSIPV